MILVQEALRIVLEHARDFGIEAIQLDQSIGRVLREDVHADRDFPPFDRVAMDGIAIVYSDFSSGQKAFQVEGLAAAGQEQMSLSSSGSCLEVMTGGILPAGADTVIRYEDLDIQDGVARLMIDDIRKGQNVHRRASDRKEGDLIVPAGKKIGHPEIAVCATVGKCSVKVSRMPSCMIISSGNELVDIEVEPQAHQIRKSNVHVLSSLLAELGVQADSAHLPDDYNTILSELRSILQDYDLVILSGGVSKGKLDFIPQALEQLDVEKVFHRVRQRPGKPFWFGKHSNAIVFAFPGNPVSTFVCALHYLKPWLVKSLGAEPHQLPTAVLAEDVEFKPGLTFFKEVRLSHSKDGQLMAHPAHGGGSGDLAKLVDADGFLVLPEDRERFQAGETFPLILF
jgi:molybdopterin molybdotransferase